MNTNVKVIGLTRLGIKPESTAQETDAPYHSAICAVDMHNQLKTMRNQLKTKQTQSRGMLTNKYFILHCR